LVFSFSLVPCSSWFPQSSPLLGFVELATSWLRVSSHYWQSFENRQKQPQENMPCKNARGEEITETVGSNKVSWMRGCHGR
jgi:hypothetical protein